MGSPQITPVTSDDDEQTQRRLTIDPQITAPDGSFYVFDTAAGGYRQVVAPWAVADHIGPVKADETFGDVESWAGYVLRFGGTAGGGVLLTWSKARLKATLDYHGDDRSPDRAQWTATYPFERTREWVAWERLANGRQMAQRELIEALEDRADDVRVPEGGELLGLLKKLRATVNMAMDATIDDNGNVSLKQEHSTSTSLKLPPTITISIPILKGHTERDGQGIEGPVRYEIEVRIRVDVLDGGKVAFRLSWPKAEQALEDAIADRVNAAKALLGELGASLYRATA
jgi:hypothetical protein